MASPDGYTLLAAMDTTMVMNPVISTDLTYDPLTDLSPVTITNKNTSLLLVRSDGPNTAKELIAKGRANPGKLNYGAGTVTTRLAAYLFTKLGGFEAQFIPFRGGAEVASGLLTGSVDFTVDGVAANLALVQSGKLRTLGKLNFSSLPALPDVEPLAVSADLPALGRNLDMGRPGGSGGNTARPPTKDLSSGSGGLQGSRSSRQTRKGRHQRDHKLA